MCGTDIADANRPGVDLEQRCEARLQVGRRAHPLAAVAGSRTTDRMGARCCTDGAYFLAPSGQSTRGCIGYLVRQGWSQLRGLPTSARQAVRKAHRQLPTATTATLLRGALAAYPFPECDLIRGATQQDMAAVLQARATRHFVGGGWLAGLSAPDPSNEVMFRMPSPDDRSLRLQFVTHQHRTTLMTLELATDAIRLVKNVYGRALGRSLSEERC